MADDSPAAQPEAVDLLEIAREILSRLTPEERVAATVEAERLGVSEEYVVMQAITQLADDPEAGVAGKA